MAGAPAAAGGTRLRVLSYNVHGQRDDTAALAALVREAAPDVAIIQEGPRRLRWRQKAAALARSTGLLVAGGGLPAMGNLIMTDLRVRVHGTWCLRFPLSPGRHLRGAVFARCSVGCTPFVVAGTHLSLDAAERVSQAALLKPQLAEPEVPVVLGADLNENSGGAAWRTVADGLVDAALAGGRGHLATFPGSGSRDRIDVVFFDSRCTLVEYQVIDTAAARSASDHLPVLVDLNVPAAT